MDTGGKTDSEMNTGGKVDSEMNTGGKQNYAYIREYIV